MRSSIGETKGTLMNSPKEPVSSQSDDGRREVVEEKLFQFILNLLEVYSICRYRPRGCAATLEW